MTAIVALILSLLTDVAGLVSTASTVAKIINALIAVLPTITQEAKDLAPTVKNIIATLKGNPATTPEQLDQLDAIEAPIDAAFDTAEVAATAEDAAAGKA